MRGVGQFPREQRVHGRMISLRMRYLTQAFIDSLLRDAVPDRYFLDLSEIGERANLHFQGTPSRVPLT